MQIEARLRTLGLTLPEAPQVPPGLTTFFAWARVRGTHVYLAGHSPQAPRRRRCSRPSSARSATWTE